MVQGSHCNVIVGILKATGESEKASLFVVQVFIAIISCSSVFLQNSEKLLIIALCMTAFVILCVIFKLRQSFIYLWTAQLPLYH